LDSLIVAHGCPNFCKIDVEGGEEAVLKGLSIPIDVISFEFTPEFIGAALNCINQLNRIGKYEYNYSVGETMKLALNQWGSPLSMCNILNSLKNNDIFGDIYARLVRNNQ
jgi:hypothetical protein